MNRLENKVAIITGGNQGAKIYINNERESDGVLLLDVNMELEREAVPERFSISFSIPDIDVYSAWSPTMHSDRHIGVDWAKRTTSSRLASSMPLHALVSASGKNKYGHLLYDEKAQERIARIKLFQQLGFSIKEIRTLMDVPGELVRSSLETRIQCLKEQKIGIDALIEKAYELMQEL